MNQKTRQLSLQFLEFLSQTNFEDLEMNTLETMAVAANQYLTGTVMHHDAVSRIQNATRFLEASEKGAAAFEIKSLQSCIRRNIHPNSEI